MVINVRTDQEQLRKAVKAGSYVYVGRGKGGAVGTWGNPFVMGLHGDRELVLKFYREWLMTQPQLLERLPELKGKTLGCWCKPHNCHGDILAELAKQS